MSHIFIHYFQHIEHQKCLLNEILPVLDGNYINVSPILPMVLFRDNSTGYGISLARYQPVIDYSTNSFACVGAFYGENSITDNASSI